MTMKKFKKGDRVKALSSGNSNIEKGGIYTVKGMAWENDGDSMGPMVVVCINKDKEASQYAFRFELVKHKVGHLPEWL